jgi:hypothetical protein
VRWKSIAATTFLPRIGRSSQMCSRSNLPECSAIMVPSAAVGVRFVQRIDGAFQAPEPPEAATAMLVHATLFG